VLNQSQQYCFQ